MKITLQTALEMLSKSGDAIISIGNFVMVNFGRKIRIIEFQDSINSLVYKSDVEIVCNELRVFSQF